MSDLGRDDFDVFEDGKPQKIDAFSYVEIPVERDNRFLFLGRPVGTDARSNRESFGGRVYVIVLDDLDISPLRTGAVKRSAREFVERYLGANDVAAVAYTSGRTEASQDFTSDRQLLLAAIDKFTGQKSRSAALDELDGHYQTLLLAGMANEPGQLERQSNTPEVAELTGVGTRKQFDLERGQRALNVLGTLKNLSEFLAGIRGRRKALLFISEGIDYPMHDVFGVHSASDVMLATRDAISTAARSNVNFFTVDPRGLIGLTSEFIDMQGIEAIMPPAQGAGVGGGVNLNTAPTPMTPQVVLLNELRLTQDALRSLAEETGGFATVNANALSSTFERIVDNNSRYYVLGYYPPSHQRDGQFHRIDVRVKRPGLRVQARRGYASPRGKTPEERKRDDDARRARDARRPNADNTSAELRDVLGRPLQQSGLTFSVQAAPFRGAQKDASVALAIEFDGDKLDFAPQNNETVFCVEGGALHVRHQRTGQSSARHAFGSGSDAQGADVSLGEGPRVARQPTIEPGAGALPAAHRRARDRRRPSRVGILRSGSAGFPEGSGDAERAAPHCCVGGRRRDRSTRSDRGEIVAQRRHQPARVHLERRPRALCRSV